MIVTITEAEWRIVLRRAREIGQAMGAERASILGARAGLEALGVTVPLIEDEVEVPQPVAAEAAVHPAEGPRPGPTRDLRVSARTAVEVDGHCDTCQSIYPAAGLGVSTAGDRVCPIHGIPVRDVVEVAEGRFELGPLPWEHKARGLGEVPECGAPIGGVWCRLNAGHLNRHDPDRATVNTAVDDVEHAPYPFEDRPA